MKKKLKIGMQSMLIDDDGSIARFTLLKADPPKYRKKFLIEQVEYKGIIFVRTLTMGTGKLKESIRLSLTKNPGLNWKTNDYDLTKVKDTMNSLHKMTNSLKGPTANYFERRNK